MGGTREEVMCPFCWDKNVRHIYDAKVKNHDSLRALMECISWEKHYWDDTKEQVTGLLNLCETFHLELEKCYEDIKNFHRSDKLNYNPRKIEEWDLLCGACPHRKFFYNHLRRH